MLFDRQNIGFFAEFRLDGDSDAVFADVGLSTPRVVAAVIVNAPGVASQLVQQIPNAIREIDLANSTEQPYSLAACGNSSFVKDMAMASQHSRRGFLRSVSHGTLIATLGPAMAVDLGLTSRAFASIATEPQPLAFGDLEPLVCLLQETEPQKLQAAIVQKIKDQTSLKSLISAAAFANARTFGGEDYIGFHTFMALSPAYRMSAMMPLGQEALPVLKVLYRNTSRIQEFGGRSSETLQQIVAVNVGATPQALQKAIRAQELAHAEALLASIGSSDSRLALEALLPCVQDNPEVHRTVLPYRAWDMQNLVGADHAITLLRQSLHYCVRMEPHRKESWNDHSQMLARLMDEFHLGSKTAGSREADDELFHHLSHTFVTASPEDCAKAAASALAEGILPSSIGEAISHAASQLVLMDAGRLPQWEDRLKPAGSVHGDSVGVHASDSANAWRNMAGVCLGQSQFACLIIGAWQIARDRIITGESADGIVACETSSRSASVQRPGRPAQSTGSCHSRQSSGYCRSYCLSIW